MGKIEDFIVLENVGFGYQKDGCEFRNILKNINLSIKSGEFIAIVGKNGCGKSTLTKLFNSINIPTQGKVTVCGMDTSDEKNLYKIRCKVGLVLQNPDNQIVSNVVEEDVAFGPENLGMDSNKIRECVDNALKSVGIYELRHKSPCNLSGGQKQRVAIAGVVAMNTQCIVLDESTSMLDPQGRREVIDTLTTLNSSGTTIILVTHYMEEAAKADRVIVLDDGTIAGDSSPRDIFSKVEFLRSKGLNIPEPTELIYRLKSKGYNLSLRSINERECANEITRYLGGKNEMFGN